MSETTLNQPVSEPEPQVEQAAAQAAHAPSSTPGPNSSSLPPEAIALASRLFEAARKGDAESEALLTAVLDRAGPRISNLTNDKGDTLIMLSSYHGHTKIVKLLLSHDADPNRLNDRGQSPLSGTVFKNERDCILALLDGGADPEIGNPNALDCCRVFKQEEYLQLFLEQVEKLKGSGRRAVNGDGHGHGHGHETLLSNENGNGNETTISTTI